MVSSRDKRHQTLWGILIRRERWGLSLCGRLILWAAIILAFFLFWLRFYAFLAVTHRVNANVLVVEGWVHEYAIRTAVREFRSNSYQQVFATGGPVEETGG